MSDEQNPILCERHGAVGVLTINRPKTLNALNVPTLLALESALTDLEKDASVRVIVITGAGGLVEIQATAEAAVFSDADFQAMLALAKKGVGELVALQKAAVA